MKELRVFNGRFFNVAELYDAYYGNFNKLSSGFKSLDAYFTNLTPVLSEPDLSASINNRFFGLCFNDLTQLKNMDILKSIYKMTDEEIEQLKTFNCTAYKERLIEKKYEEYVEKYPEFDFIPSSRIEFSSKLLRYKSLLLDIKVSMQQQIKTKEIEGFLTNIPFTDDDELLLDQFFDGLLTGGFGMFVNAGPKDRFKMNTLHCHDYNLIEGLPFRSKKIDNSLYDRFQNILVIAPRILVEQAALDADLFAKIKAETAIDPIIDNFNKNTNNSVLQTYSFTQNQNMETYPVSNQLCQSLLKKDVSRNELFLMYDTTTTDIKDLGSVGKNVLSLINNELPIFIGRSIKEKFNLLYILADIAVHNDINPFKKPSTVDTSKSINIGLFVIIIIIVLVVVALVAWNLVLQSKLNKYVVL